MNWMGLWWDGGEMEGNMLAGVGMGAPSLALERKLQHWLLRSSGRWEAVDGTNCIGAARARSICVGE